MSDSEDGSKARGGLHTGDRGDGQSAGGGRPGQVERYDGPRTWPQVAGQALEKLTDIVAPEMVRVLGKNLKHITDTRKRSASFALSFMLGMTIAATAMAVAATYGYMLGIPFSATILVFVGYLTAASAANIGVLRDRWTTSELDEVARLNVHRDEKFSAIQAYAEERRRLGVPASTIADEVASAQRKVLEEHLADLKKLARNRTMHPKALPPPAAQPPDEAPSMERPRRSRGVQ